MRLTRVLFVGTLVLSSEASLGQSWKAEKTPDYSCQMEGESDGVPITLRGRSLDNYEVTFRGVGDHLYFSVSIGGRSMVLKDRLPNDRSLTAEVGSEYGATGLDLLASEGVLTLYDGTLVDKRYENGALVGARTLAFLDKSIHLTGIAPAVAQFRDCLKNFVSPARPITALNHQEWMTADDLLVMLKKDRQWLGGIYFLQVDVGPDGVITDCRVRNAKDEEQSFICGLVRARAKFLPEIDDKGNRQAATYRQTIELNVP